MFPARWSRVRAIDLCFNPNPNARRLGPVIGHSQHGARTGGEADLQGPASMSGWISAGDIPSVHTGPHAGPTQNKPSGSTDESRGIRSDALAIECRKYKLPYAGNRIAAN